MVAYSPLFMEVLIILLFIFLYQMIYNKPSYVNTHWRRRNNGIIFILCLFSIGLLMHFPFSFYPGNIYDLRKIPLLLGIMYGGYTVGTSLTVALIVYRFILGVGLGAINTLVLYSVILMITLMIVPYYDHFSSRKKTMVISLLAIIFSLAGPLFDFIEGIPVTNIEFLFYFVYALLNGMIMALSVYLVENMREHKRLTQEIARREKLEVISQLTASVAHEIRNPLAASRGFIQLALESTKENKMKYYLDTAISEMDRSLDIINDYLSFAKPEFETIQSIIIQDVIQRTVSIIAPYAHMHNVAILVHDGPQVSVSGNPKKFKQCLVNVMKNGIESMPDGGELVVSVREENRHVIVSINDNGNGMSEEQIKRLGTPFYSTKEQGTGLGLMASYTIIEAMKGRISVESTMNEGTTFHIQLPIMEESIAM